MLPLSLARVLRGVQRGELEEEERMEEEERRMEGWGLQRGGAPWGLPRAT